MQIEEAYRTVPGKKERGELVSALRQQVRLEACPPQAAQTWCTDRTDGSQSPALPSRMTTSSLEAQPQTASPCARPRRSVLNTTASLAALQARDVLVEQSAVAQLTAAAEELAAAAEGLGQSATEGEEEEASQRGAAPPAALAEALAEACEGPKYDYVTVQMALKASGAGLVSAGRRAGGAGHP